MSGRRGFTLIEVAVAGTLIGLTVAATLAIIPAGLKAQHQARMRAVAAATVAYMFYSQNHWTSSLSYSATGGSSSPQATFGSPTANFVSECTSGSHPMLQAISASPLTFAADPAGTSGTAVTGNLTTLYCLRRSDRSLSNVNGNAAIDLGSRLVFGFRNLAGSPNQYLVVWECTVDPSVAKPGKLIELATFNYYDPF
jgi:Tfp pilus assembly protein PilE